MILWSETEVNKFATSLFLFITDDSHASIIWNYRRISKSFLLPNMKYESIKYEAIIWKIRKTKIAYFRWPFSGRSKQFVSGWGCSQIFEEWKCLEYWKSKIKFTLVFTNSFSIRKILPGRLSPSELPSVNNFSLEIALFQTASDV